MTMPAEPATGTPAPGTGDPSQQPTAPDADPGQQPATGSDDWATTFEGLTPAEVKEKLDHARTWENRAKRNKDALDKLKANGKPEGAPLPEDVQAQLDEATSAREAAEARAVELTYETTVSRIAGQVGADAEALLDSQAFRDAVAAELDDDGFDDDELKAAVAKHAKEFAKKARFSATPTGPSRSGTEINGGTGGPRQITDAELATMTPEQIVAAQENGQLNALLGRT